MNNIDGSFEIICQDCNHTLKLSGPINWREVSRKRRALGDEVVYSLDTVHCKKCNSLIEATVFEYPEAVIREVVVSINKKILFIDYNSCPDFFKTAINGHHKQEPQLGNNTSPSMSLYKSVLEECFKQRDRWKEKYGEQLGPHDEIPRKFHKEFSAVVSGCLGPLSKVERVGKSASMTNKWDDDIVSLFHMRLGGSVGSMSPISTAKFAIGNCAEQHAANMVMLEGKKKKITEEPNKLVFTESIRPRTMQVIDCCPNCSAVFDTL